MIHRGGAEEARRFTLWAHNSEVIGSNPISGIFQFASFREAGCHSASDIKLEHLVTGVAQRKRAGLITPRS